MTKLDSARRDLAESTRLYRELADRVAATFRSLSPTATAAEAEQITWDVEVAQYDLARRATQMRLDCRRVRQLEEAAGQ